MSPSSLLDQGLHQPRGDPELFTCGSRAEEMDTVASVLKTWLAECETQTAYKPEHLAVLVRSKAQRAVVMRAMSERGLEVREVDTEPVGRGKPIVMTMHRSKGTEFRNVVLAGADPLNPGGSSARGDQSEDIDVEAIQRERSLLYVAATRARDRLVVVHE